MKELGPKAGEREVLAERLAKAKSDLAHRRKLEDLRTRREKAEAAHGKFLKKQKAAETKFAAARAELEKLQDLWAKAQAGLLAQTLVTGEPCPVCGATAHPSPAHLAEGVPGEAALIAQRDALAELEAAREKAREDESAKRNDVTVCDAEIGALEDSLGEKARLSPEALADACEELARRAREAGEATEEFTRIAGELERAKEKAPATGKALEEADGALREAAIALEGARAVVAEKESGLPEDLRTLPALEKEVRSARATLDALKKAFDQAQKEASTAGEEYAACREALQGAEKAAKAAARKSKEAEKNFAARLAAAGFADAEDFEASKREDEEIESLLSEIEEFEGSLRAGRIRAAKAAKATKGLARPDLDLLEESAREAKSLLESALEGQATVKTELAQAKAWLADLADTGKKRTDLEARYAVVGKLAEVANGKNPAGVAFQRFVLSALLDDVLVASTERLKVMSRGRFSLERVRERADRRIAGGLDLVVYDSYTGTARPVSTLSGGESFLASLSLALGLADVVEAYAGGLHLETIFVDEGFGSLDPEALDRALEALVDLQEGKRLVGIISHVPELKERIDVRLEVTATRRGSTARFVGVGPA
jgi:exonuclease SbcC